MQRALSRRFSHCTEELRRYGYLIADTNPLFPKIPVDPIYTGKLGVEFMHLASSVEREWWINHLEGVLPHWKLSPSEEKNYFRLLSHADAFEGFLSRKLATLKRYGGEGLEAQLPALQTLLAGAHSEGCLEAVVSSAHRGRLATQVCLLRYPARKLFWKLLGNDDIPASVPGVDDVSSHIAVSVDHFVGNPWGGSLLQQKGGATTTSDSAPMRNDKHNEGRIHVSLLPNPSHLEAVNPVAAGKARAKQDAIRRTTGGGGVVPIIVHGDAAVAAQGVVYEMAALSQSPGYAVGGSLHLIANNQLGFTHTPTDGGLPTGCFGKLTDSPILHVNAECPSSVVLACRLASAYRGHFRKDIVVDLCGYRRNGHNEVDEPAFTSPELYARIRSRPTHTSAYGEELTQRGVLAAGEVLQLSEAAVSHFEEEWRLATTTFTPETGSSFSSQEDGRGVLSRGDGSAFSAGSKWQGFRPAKDCAEVGHSPPTGVPLDTLLRVGKGSVSPIPHGFTPHPRLVKGHMSPRLEALETALKDPHAPCIDWSTAEAMAFGSILLDGCDVRLSGQDSARGTFSHRHAVLHHQGTHDSGSGASMMTMASGPITTHTPLDALSGCNGPRFSVHSSPLSESAVLGFEYGYSLESPRSLVLWEAQFGDFANCAQSVIDTFIASGESKWLRQSGLTLLLPHGQDGAGPEHSSARLERFLSLTHSPGGWGASPPVLPNPAVVSGQWEGDKSLKEPCNWIVANPSTPANYFHALRRQVSPTRPFRKPLVLMAPKTLLRLPAAQSSLREFGPGSSFSPVLPDEEPYGAAAPPLLLLCSGKIYYELCAQRAVLSAEGGEIGARACATRIIRLEQLAPWPAEALGEAMSHAGARDPRRGTATTVTRWVQEEPANAGAWEWVRTHTLASFPRGIAYVGRPSLPAPAVGLSIRSKSQQARLLRAAFA